MSCSLAVAAVLLFADPSAVPVNATADARGAIQASGPVAEEPLFADIIARATGLKALTEGWAASGAADAPGFFDGSAWAAFLADAEALAALNMQGHVTLRERGTDGDLKCILRGISEDMPGRVAAIQAAPGAPERAVALSELTHLLDDNAAVILAPPHQEN